MAGRFYDIQNEVIAKYGIDICDGTKCKSDWRRTHTHVGIRRICKWISKNSVRSTFTLFHEIGHVETTKAKMRRCEAEFYATKWAISLSHEYGIEIPSSIITEYQNYIYMELERGIRRHGNNLPTKEQLKILRGRKK
jgi:hypothetical protein